MAHLSGNKIIVPDDKRTRTAEEFRQIKRSVILKAFGNGSETANNSNLVMITSTRPGEGKTFTATNLAMSIATERDLTVLLVDADLPNPNVMKNFGLTAERGLVDILENDELDLADVLLRTDIDRLSVLPAGRRHSMGTELMASDRMRRVVGDIAMRYKDRIVIFDAPPVLATTEPSILAQHVGQIVFVVEAEKTTRIAIQSALELLSECPDISMVLNRGTSGIGGSGFGHYYDYYGKYGYEER
jgi:receptor protein-tyrosine kinase